MSNYNPYRTENSSNSILSNVSPNQTGFFNRQLSRLSKFGRSYSEFAIQNAKGIHANEDLSQMADANGYGYTLFSRKVHALMQEKQTIAALSSNYLSKLTILREYATKIDIRDFVTKMANEIIVYGKDKKFCELEDLPQNYSEVVRKRVKTIFENVYAASGFADGSAAWDICHNWLVEGYICREIIYDAKGKNVVGFQKLDPATIIPIVDADTQLKIWVQHPYDEQNRRILLDAEIIYISYSGSSSFMELSYVEPLIRPYNELKSIERSKLMFNLINATMHKEFIIPTQGLSQIQAEQEMAQLIADYKDHVAFDDTTGLIYIDGSKDLPYSKEYWFPNPGDTKPEMSIIEPGGHDLNENSMLIWFKNQFKAASKFPLSRLDNSIGGGNIYSIGGEITHDDYNFEQYVERCRTLYKEILLKPIVIQILLEFPELEKNNNFYNDIDISYYGHSEIIKAKTLANLQAKATIANDLLNFKRDETRSVLHWRYIAKHIMEFTDEEMAENDKYWKEDSESGGASTEMSGGLESGDTGLEGGNTETGINPEPSETGSETPEVPPTSEETPPETPTEEIPPVE